VQDVQAGCGLYRRGVEVCGEECGEECGGRVSGGEVWGW